MYFSILASYFSFFVRIFCLSIRRVTPATGPCACARTPLQYTLFLLYASFAHSSRLQDLLLDRCGSSVQTAHALYWFLRAFCLQGARVTPVGVTAIEQVCVGVGVWGFAWVGARVWTRAVQKGGGCLQGAWVPVIGQVCWCWWYAYGSFYLVLCRGDARAGESCAAEGGDSGHRHECPLCSAAVF